MAPLPPFPYCDVMIWCTFISIGLLLFFLTALFLGFLILMSIILMAVGKYYSQTKALSLLKMRIPPKTELLDQDAQYFVS